jgi:hypothetical protein
MEAGDAAVTGADVGLRTTDADLEVARQQLAEEQKKRESAEQERDAARQHLQSERGGRFAAQEAAVASALETAKGRLAEAKRAYARAMSDSRYEDGAELQEQIAEATLEVRGLAWQHQQLEQAKHPEIVGREAAQKDGEGAIIVDGLMLMERPSVITKEAAGLREERAKERVRNQVKSLKLTPEGQLPRVRVEAKKKYNIQVAEADDGASSAVEE